MIQNRFFLNTIISIICIDKEIPKGYNYFVKNCKIKLSKEIISDLQNTKFFQIPKELLVC
jgi:hypothetical protein